MSGDHTTFLCGGMLFRLRRIEEIDLPVLLADILAAQAAPPTDLPALSLWVRSELERYQPASQPLPDLCDPDVVRSLAAKLSGFGIMRVVLSILRRVLIDWRGRGPQFAIDRLGCPSGFAINSIRADVFTSLWAHTAKLLMPSSTNQLQVAMLGAAKESQNADQ